MSMLLFMPWCRIDKAYQVGDIELLPFERHEPIKDLNDALQCRINAIMATYKTIEGKSVEHAALVGYRNRSLVDDLSDEEIDPVHELVALACFCALAKRAYFSSLGPYCNSDCFALCVQKFDNANFTALTSRRREGRTLSGWAVDDISITIPVHCHTVREVTLDEALLKALVSHRDNSEDEWGRWQNAISSFNQANTDSDTIRYQVEWVLLCSAFEHLLEAKPEAKDVANKFSGAMVPSGSLLASQAQRRSGSWRDNRQPLRYEWMREFYRLRGDFAHGKLNPQQPAVWSPLEHLVLSSIAFPLVVKCLLKRDGTYDLTYQDEAQIECFEPFADIEDFLNPPPDRKGSLDSHWKRFVEAHKSRLALQRAFDRARENLSPEQRELPESDSNEGNT